MHNLHFTDDFLYDVEDIVTWYDSIRKGLSFDFELCLEVGIAEIIKYPESFQKRYKNGKS